MAKLNILKSVNSEVKSTAGKIGGPGWFKETDRHSRAAKTGHAGGQYSTGNNGSTGKSKKSDDHTHKASAADWSGNKFCEICGKAL